MNSQGRCCHDIGLRSVRGAALLLALVFLLLLAMLAATVMRTSILQLHMAGNDQFMEEAVHQAQAVATELSLRAENFYLRSAVDEINCPEGDMDPGCNYTRLPPLVQAMVPDGVALDYRVTRQAPLLWRGFPIREAEAIASSSTRFDAAMFEILVQVDGAGISLGSARIAQGIAVRVAGRR